MDAEKSMVAKRPDQVAARHIAESVPIATLKFILKIK